MKYALIIVGILSSVMAIGSEGDNRASTVQAAVSEALNAKKYEIDINHAHPMGWKSINLTSSYSIRISGDSLYCHLPYYGRAYNVPYGGGEGLVFTSTTNNYKITEGKRGVKRIEFDTNSRDGNNKFSIEVWQTGQSNINVTPAGRASISYSGSMELDKNKTTD